MSSRYANIIKSQATRTIPPFRLSDFDADDPYYFVIRENGKTIAEGELKVIRSQLDKSFFTRNIRKISRDRITMVATVDL